MIADQRTHLRELEAWKQRAARSPDGTFHIGAGCHIVSTQHLTLDFPPEAETTS